VEQPVQGETVESRVRGIVELIEVSERTELKDDPEAEPLVIETQKIKVALTDGDFNGTSLFTELDKGTLNLRVGDQVIVNQTLIGNELTKIEILDLDRTKMILWMFITFIIILLSIVGKQIFRKLTPFLIISILTFVGLLTYSINSFGSYIGAAIVLSIMIVLSVYTRKGFERSSLIAIVGSISSMAFTAVLLIFFTESIRISTPNQDLYNAGVLITTTGIIFSNATQIAFGIKENLVKQFEISRSKILSQGISISKTISSSGLNILMLAFIGFGMIKIFDVYNSGANFIDLINSPSMAQLLVSFFASAIGVLLVPLITVVLSFFIIDINKLGRRVPKQTQLDLEV